MTTQEAIKILDARSKCIERSVSGVDTFCNNKECDNCKLNYAQGTMGEQREALNMAVTALGAIDQIQWERDIAIKQLHDLGYGLGEKPRDDNSSSDKLIKASDAVDVVAKHSALYGDGEISTDDGEALLYDIMSEIMNLPSAQPNLQPTCNNLQQVATDTISRQAAIDAANRADYRGLTVEDVKKVTDEVVKELKQLSPAQPERKTGRWVKKSTEWRYECSECGSRPPKAEWVSGRYLSRYCPYCGARMEGDFDEDDKQ